jgi:hypothetical protein
MLARRSLYRENEEARAAAEARLAELQALGLRYTDWWQKDESILYQNLSNLGDVFSL